MAVVSMILGGMAGFFSAAVGLIALNLSWLAALGLWSGVGTAVAALILALALLPKSPASATQGLKRA
ncbi:MAG: hypothetical protein ACOH2M_12190 [Cypionkella sp.]